jgi:hypothetical protein
LLGFLLAGFEVRPCASAYLSYLAAFRGNPIVFLLLLAAGGLTNTLMQSDPQVWNRYWSARKTGALHRIATNPMRASPADPDGWTRTTRDTVGRVLTVETFSGRYPSGTSTGVVSTEYNADQTTVTDQAGKKRRSRTDGLGRLVEVFEDPLGLNYSTT